MLCTSWIKSWIKKEKKGKEEFYCVNSKMFDDKTIETKIIIKR